MFSVAVTDSTFSSPSPFSSVNKFSYFIPLKSYITVSSKHFCMFSYFGHCIYSAIQLSSCKCVLNKLSCQLSVVNITTSSKSHRSVYSTPGLLCKDRILHAAVSRDLAKHGQTMYVLQSIATKRKQEQSFFFFNRVTELIDYIICQLVVK